MIIYQMLFAFFYKLGSGQWPAELNADAHKGVVGVSLLEAIFALSISNIIQANTGHRITVAHVWLWAFFLGVVGLNYYLLVSLRLGIEFIPKLEHYPKPKRACLYGLASGLLLMTTILFLYSVKIFHHAFLP